MLDVKIFEDEESLIRGAVERFINISELSIYKHGHFSVALSGGSTPKPIYEALGHADNRERLPWEKIHLFWGDERYVPPTHSDSNYWMVKESLLDHVPIPPENVHRVPAEMEIRMAALSYENELRGFFSGKWPRFDLVLLGMGDDGHTASLFPYSEGLNEGVRWFIANYAPYRESWRLTLTKNAINAARNIMVLVGGQSKAKMLAEVLVGPKSPAEKPIQLISPVNGEMTWLVDEAAASQLPDGWQDLD